MKKILIIGNYSINSNDPVGITLRSFFDENNFDVKDLYRLSKKQKNEAHYKSDKINSNVFPLESLIRKAIRQEQAEDRLALENIPRITLKEIFKQYIKYTSESLINLNKNSELLDEIHSFEPNYIYTIGESVASLKLSYLISKKMNVPLVIHFMDNWLETLYSESPFLKKKLESLTKKIVKHADKIIVISEKMKKEYADFFDIKDIYILRNISEDYSRIIEKTNLNKDIINISYIGGIHLKRWESLLEFSKKLSPNNFKLNIYTINPVSDLIFNKFVPYNVEFKKAVPHDKLVQIYNKSDILIHVESFNEDINKYIKYSFSTKITEYIFSGLPIIYYGPKNIAVAEYLEVNELAFVLDDLKNLDYIQNELSDEEKRIEIGKKVHKFGENNLSNDMQNKKVNKIFS